MEQSTHSSADSEIDAIVWTIVLAIDRETNQSGWPEQCTDIRLRKSLGLGVAAAETLTTLPRCGPFQRHPSIPPAR